MTKGKKKKKIRRRKGGAWTVGLGRPGLEFQLNPVIKYATLEELLSLSEPESLPL